MFKAMLKVIFKPAAVVFIGGIFCAVYAQDKEAVIKLDSPEKIEAFQKILQGGTENDASPSGAAEAEEKKMTPAEAGFSAADLNKKSLKEAGHNVVVPQAKEAVSRAGAAAAIHAPGADKEDFKVFIPQAKEEIVETEISDKRIKNLDSPEDIAEFEELLRKAKLE